MHPATVHGVGVITELYFAIFAAFKDQWPWISLRSHLRSSILVSIESVYTHSY